MDLEDILGKVNNDCGCGSGKLQLGGNIDDRLDCEDMLDIKTPFSEGLVSITGLIYVEIRSKYKHDNNLYSINKMFLDRQNFDILRSFLDVYDNQSQQCWLETQQGCFYYILSRVKLAIDIWEVYEDESKGIGKQGTLFMQETCTGRIYGKRQGFCRRLTNINSEIAWYDQGKRDGYSIEVKARCTWVNRV